MRISDWSSDVCSSDLEAVLIGFGTDTGTVAAASDWGADMQIKTVRPARVDSYEHAFRRTGIARSLTDRSEEHTSELQSLMRISYAVFCLKKQTQHRRYQ